MFSRRRFVLAILRPRGTDYVDVWILPSGEAPDDVVADSTPVIKSSSLCGLPRLSTVIDRVCGRCPFCGSFKG